MTIKNKDFIEIEFTGRVKETGEVFDSNVQEELEKLHKGHSHKIEAKPFIFSIGEGMFLKGVEDFLIGKEASGEHKIELEPESAFGKRDKKLIQLMPLRVFTQQKIKPVPGFTFNFDGRVGKVLSSSGGRVIVDFNNPLSGKEVIYDVKIIRKVDDLNEKVKSFIDFLFRRELPFKIQDKKVTIEVKKELFQFANLFKDKFKDVFGLELEVIQKPEASTSPQKTETKEIEEKPADKK